MHYESRGRYLAVLMDKIRQDMYPSSTHMDLIESAIPPEAIPIYVEVLLEKIENDPHPSISMLRRVERMTEIAR